MPRALPVDAPIRAPKRSDLEREEDRLMVWHLRRLGVGANEIIRRLGDLAEERARRALVAQGVPPSEAAAQASRYRLTGQSIRRDGKVVANRLRKGSEEAYQLFVLDQLVRLVERYGELDLDLLRNGEHTEQAEADMMAQRTGDEVELVEYGEPMFTTDAEGHRVPALNAAGEQRLGPKGVTRRTRQKAPDPRWHAALAAHQATRLRIYAEQRENMAEQRQLAPLVSPALRGWPLDLADLRSRAEAKEELVAGELARMGRVEAIASGRSTEGGRIRLLSALLQSGPRGTSLPPEAGRDAARGGAPTGAAVVTFRIEGMPMPEPLALGAGDESEEL
jgi:hypothetical protein